MGYAHGKKWNVDLIECAIKYVMRKAKISTFPTHSQMTTITGNTALANAVSKNGGSHYWSEKLGLEIKPCESKFGEEFELKCMNQLKHYGYRCEKMPVRYPYDLLVENNVKTEIKCGNLFHGKTGDYYTFNLGKQKPTCDIFVCYCLENNEIRKIYIIPSSVLSGKTQLAIGKYSSIYDSYFYAWSYFQEYADFYKRMGC